MPFSKVLASGSMGSITVSEDAGVVSLSGQANVSLGGGDMAGVATLVSNNSVQLSVVQAADVGMMAAEVAYPQFAPEIAALKALFDGAVKSV